MKSRHSGIHWVLYPAVAIALALGLMSLTGCHTVEGAGKDIQDLGEGVEDAAD